MSRLDHCHNIADIRELAEKRVPKAVFDYADGGANDEIALHNNSSAYDKFKIVPKALVDVDQIDTSTEIMNTPVDWPLLLAPTAINHFFNSCGEPGVARTAEELGTAFTLSSIASSTIEEIAVETTRRWYQLYVFKDRGITYDFVRRCKEHQYKALVLTVDTPLGGRRERDLHHGMTIPPKLTARTVLEAGLHPNWWIPYLLGRPMSFANVDSARANSHPGSKAKPNFANMMTYMNSQFDQSVTWDDAEELIKAWGGQFAVKGIMNPDDAKRAVDIGATCIIVSNHGGRQLDAAPAPIDMLPLIRQAVGDSAQIVCDSGIRRGSDIIKALARGADACMTGRPYIYGLCAGGQQGVNKALQLLKDELTLSMKLSGLTCIDDIKGDIIQPIYSK